MATALTGAAVLRAFGRIFLRLGPEPDPAEANSPSQSEQESPDRPLWLMMAPCFFLLACAIAPGAIAASLGVKAAVSFAPSLAMPAKPAAVEFVPWLSLFLAFGIASLELFRDRLPGRPVRFVTSCLDTILRPAGRLHGGLVNDYVLWMLLGLASFSLSPIAIGGIQGGTGREQVRR